jgi:ElaB/YqjD/DUF883 family membrane-anchored ribosome-binding protein
MRRRGVVATDVREEQRGKEVEALKVEVDKLRADLAATTRTLREVGGSLGEQAAERVRVTADRARQRVSKTADDVSHQIEERPLVSIIGAFLVGLLLGALFSRR